MKGSWRYALFAIALIILTIIVALWSLSSSCIASSICSSSIVSSPCTTLRVRTRTPPFLWSLSILCFMKCLASVTGNPRHLTITTRSRETNTLVLHTSTVKQWHLDQEWFMEFLPVDSAIVLGLGARWNPMQGDQKHRVNHWLGLSVDNKNLYWYQQIKEKNQKN